MDDLENLIRVNAYFIWQRRKALNDAGADNADENWAKAKVRIERRTNISMGISMSRPMPDRIW